MSDSSSPAARCPQCRTPKPASGGALSELCPACLLEGALTPPSPAPSTAPSPPTPATQPETSSAPPTSPQPSSFGPYLLLEELASGGMGIVYKALQVNLNRIVAIKKLRAGSHATAEDRLRFRIEAEAAAKLQHPHIVAVHEVGVIEETPYLSMDYIDGLNLAQRISASAQPIHPQTAARVTLEIARAVSYAHKRGVLHRDLKPSNILVDHHGRPHVTDFGLAKLVSSDSSMTKTGMVMGSPSYMSPEQARGEETDVTTDVHALGAILFEMLCGIPPYRGSTCIETLRQVQEVDAELPKNPALNIPKDLENICLKCLAKDRNRRYASARLLAEDLERFLRHEPVLARPLPPLARLGRWCQRHPGWAAAAGSSAALGAAMILLTALFLIRLQKESTSTRNAQQEAESQLHAASIAQARAERWSALPDSRQRSLRALKVAAELHFDSMLLDEGAATLATPDVGKPLWFRPGTSHPYLFNSSFDEHVLADATGTLHFYRGSESSPYKSLPGPHTNIVRLLLAPGHESIPDRIGVLHAHGIFRVLNWSGTDFLEETSFPSPQLHLETRSQALALGPHAKQLALLTTDRGVVLEQWNVSSQSWHSSRIPSGGPYSTMAFSPQGTQLAITTPKGVEIWELSGNQLNRRLEYPQPATAIAWHPDGRRIASGHRSGDILVWDLETGERRTLLGHSGYISTLAFSPQGNWLISHSWDGTSRFWQGHTGQHLLTMLDGLAVAMNHNESRIAFHRESGGYGLAPASTPQCFITLPDPLIDPTSITFHPTRPWIASETRDRILIWNLQTQQRIATIPLRNSRGLLFHPQGDAIYAFSGPKLFRSQISHPDSDSPQFATPESITEEPDNPVSQTRWSLGGQAMVVAGSQYSFALSVEAPEKRLYFGDYSAGSWLAVSPDSEWAALSQFNGPGLTLWKKNVGLVALLRTNVHAQVDFSPNGRWLAGCTERSWHLWNRENFSIHHEETHATGGIIPGVVRFSPKENILALSQDRRSIRLVHPESAQTRLTLQPPHPGLIKIIEFSPDGRWLALYEENLPLRLWDLQTLKQELSQTLQLQNSIW